MHYNIMTNVNLQVRLAPEMEAQIEQLAPGSKSAFVRQAIEEKIQREKFRRLEEQWIKALQKHPEDSQKSEAWLKAEAWETS